MDRFVVYRLEGQWIGSRLWYWKKRGAPDEENHGPFWPKALATVAAWWGTR